MLWFFLDFLSLVCLSMHFWSLVALLNNRPSDQTRSLLVKECLVWTSLARACSYRHKKTIGSTVGKINDVAHAARLLWVQPLTENNKNIMYVHYNWGSCILWAKFLLNSLPFLLLPSDYIIIYPRASPERDLNRVARYRESLSLHSDTCSLLCSLSSTSSFC